MYVFFFKKIFLVDFEEKYVPISIVPHRAHKNRAKLFSLSPKIDRTGRKVDSTVLNFYSGTPLRAAKDNLIEYEELNFP